ncbi:hypothetical protein [Bradyrhizobium cosmicum]|uniref:hypothetical protein n=1 Tax=Bradyrhizobium cosmicum TaxID=1404864 RepID=UPI001163D54A|nr:hypothetical protein [Bradyrhizobium cosmicum]QDP26254.1 hypothetical protein FNV92_30660 [Bradyrhizobium cosmicum]
MTIAACYLSPEGLVLGADSTSTYANPDGHHYFNHAQKLFEVGEGSSLGIVTWGLGGLAVSSYRMLIAELADDLTATPPTSVAEVAHRWCDHFWNAYASSSFLAPLLARRDVLRAKTEYQVGVPPAPSARTEDEEDEFARLLNTLGVGFCIGGHVASNRRPAAFEITIDPYVGAKPSPVDLPVGTQKFWGVPNLILRLIRGCDIGLRNKVLASGKWAGTPAEFDAFIDEFTLQHPGTVPIRDAIDFTYTCILSTIKAMKFSNLPQVCGGPIEIAVITNDRNFRWVRHKPLDAAIAEGDVS